MATSRRPRARARRQQRARRPQWGGQLVRRLHRLVRRRGGGAARDISGLDARPRPRSRRSVPPRRMRQGSGERQGRVRPLAFLQRRVAARRLGVERGDERPRAPAPPIGRWNPVSALEYVDRHLLAPLARARFARSACDRRDAHAARARRLHRIRPAVPRGPHALARRPHNAAEADLCDGANGLGACTLRALARRVATLNATRSSQSISRVEAERSLLVEYGVVRPSVPDDRPSARPPHSLFFPCSLHHRSRRAP